MQQPTSDEVYKQINNALYNEQGRFLGGMKTNVCTCSSRRSIRSVLGTSEDSSIKGLSSTIAARRWM